MHPDDVVTQPRRLSSTPDPPKRRPLRPRTHINSSFRCHVRLVSARCRLVTFASPFPTASRPAHIRESTVAVPRSESSVNLSSDDSTSGEILDSRLASLAVRSAPFTARSTRSRYPKVHQGDIPRLSKRRSIISTCSL